MEVRSIPRAVGIAGAVLVLTLLPACSGTDPVVGGGAGAPGDGPDSETTVTDDTPAVDDQGDSEQDVVDEAQDNSATEGDEVQSWR